MSIHFRGRYYCPTLLFLKELEYDKLSKKLMCPELLLKLKMQTSLHHFFLFLINLVKIWHPFDQYQLKNNLVSYKLQNLQ